MIKWQDIVRAPAPALIPSFGPLAGIRVISSGSIIAMPHAASMMADFGAEVIHLERPGVGDTYRGMAPFIKEGDKVESTSWAQDARNRLSMSFELDLKIPEAKEVFFGLIKQADIWMENMVWIEKLGITEQMVLEVNPKLVIVHISGYGRPQFGGLPEYCDRPSYDMIGQAYSGFMNMAGMPEPAPPIRANPWTNDYISALHAVFGAMAAYVHAQKTGKGQVVDVAQYEANARILADTFVTYLESNVVRSRSGNKAAAFQPYDCFKAQDRWVVMGAFGPAVYKRFLQAVGLDPDYYTWKECASSIEAVKSAKGTELDKLTREWIATRPAKEVADHMAKFKVPSAVVYNAEDAYKDPHWQGRNNFIEYEDQVLGRSIKAFGIVPKMADTPGQVWRGAPRLGQDTEQVLKTLLGYSDKDIESLRGKGVI